MMTRVLENLDARECDCVAADMGTGWLPMEKRFDRQVSGFHDAWRQTTLLCRAVVLLDRWVVFEFLAVTQPLAKVWHVSEALLALPQEIFGFFWPNDDDSIIVRDNEIAGADRNAAARNRGVHFAVHLDLAANQPRD